MAGSSIRALKVKVGRNPVAGTFPNPSGQYWAAPLHTSALSKGASPLSGPK